MSTNKKFHHNINPLKEFYLKSYKSCCNTSIYIALSFFAIKITGLLLSNNNKFYGHPTPLCGLHSPAKVVEVLFFKNQKIECQYLHFQWSISVFYYFTKGTFPIHSALFKKWFIDNNITILKPKKFFKLQKYRWR